MIQSNWIRFGLVSTGVALGVVAQVDSAFAVPSDKEAWRNDEHGIVIYKDAVDPEVYWYIPKIRFEAKDGKTVLRPKTLASGKIEYTVRIIPYFSKDLKELAAQNIPNIRQDSQLKPVVARSIGISLPDFSYKFASANVTNFQYLDVPRLLKFALDPEEASTFDELYQDEAGINVDFAIAYDGMMTDKFYNIDVSCKEMATELEMRAGVSPSVEGNVKGAKVYLGADLEYAFLNSVQNSLKGVSIVSKGNVPGMQEMLSRVMNLCFEPEDPYDSNDGYPTRRRRTEDEDETDDDFESRFADRLSDRLGAASFAMTNRSTVNMAAVAYEQQLIQELHDSMVIDPPQDQEPRRRETDDGGLLPEAQLKAKFRMKKTNINHDNEAVVKNLSMKDTTNVYVVAGFLAANAKQVEKVEVTSLGDKKFSVKAEHRMATPLKTGIIVKSGEQYSINAAYVFKARTSYSGWQSKQYDWDSKWAKTDGDLYFRIGTGHWTPVNGRSIIESSVIGGGELEFYLDHSAIFNKIPNDLRESSCLGLCAPVFTIKNLAPEFSVQVSGRRISVR